MQFRIWASDVIKEYMKKGFAINDQRLKELGGGNYFHELLNRILSNVEKDYLQSMKLLEDIAARQ